MSLNGKTLESWCIEWNEDASFGLNEGTNLYSTKGKEAWKELNYFMSIKDDLLANDPDLTYKEVQVVIWSLIEKPSFDVNRIGEYENISERIYKDGKPLFNVQKVKDLLNQINEDLRTSNPKSWLLDLFVIFIQNEGQTIMIKPETAFAYGNEYAECFTDIEGLISNKWGWTNGKLGEGEYEFDLYAGAGQCNLSNGTLVGKVKVNYLDGSASIIYKMTENSGFTDELYKLLATHLHVGNDKLPKFLDQYYTAAPGLFSHKSYHNNATEYTYTVDGLEGEIYISAHAVVNGFGEVVD